MMKPNRRQRDALGMRAVARWSTVFERWLRRIRILIGLISVLFLGLQFSELMRHPKLQSTLVILVVACLLIIINRKQMGRFVYRPRSFVSRWIQFPGHLLVVGLTCVVIGSLLPSLALAAAGAVFYLGWILGRQCDSHGWNAIAPGWTLLFFLCIPSNLNCEPLARVERWAIGLASQYLDLHSALHSVDSQQLNLIVSNHAISLESNVFFSYFTLFVLVGIYGAIRRFSVVLSIVGLIATIPCGALLLPVRIVLGGWLSTLESLPRWVVTDEALQAFAFVTCGLLLASITGIGVFGLGAITATRNMQLVDNRLSRTWNRWTQASIAQVMFADHSTDSTLDPSSIVSSQASVKRFLRNYIITRRWGHLLAGIPIVALALSIANGSQRLITSVSLTSRFVPAYHHELGQKILKKDFVAAELLVDRLADLAPVNSQPAIELAEAYIKEHRKESAKDVMRKWLAHDPANSHAHYWIAADYLQNDSPSTECIQLAKLHLKSAIESDSSNWQAVNLYALLLMSLGQRTDAAALLREYDPENSNLDLGFARLQHRLGFHADAANRSRRLISELQEQVAPSMTPPDCLRLAQAFALAGDVHSALKTLESAAVGTEPDKDVRESTIRILLAMCRLDSPDARQYRYERLRKAMLMNPQNPDLILYCARLMFTIDSTVDTNTALIALCRNVTENALRSPDTPAELFTVVGTGAAQQGNYESAVQYLQTAYDKGERSAAVLNNLAWVICQAGNGDRRLALRLVDEAIAKESNSCDSLSTRAEILVSLQRYKDAIVDLERIVSLNGQTKKTFDQLAELYEFVGDSETARSYSDRHTKKSLKLMLMPK